MLSVPQSYMESNSDIYSNAICYAEHLQKQICSTLLCSIYYLNYFAK